MYQTTEECSLPDLENDDFGYRPIKEPEEDNNDLESILNFGQVQVQECGLVNLAVVLTQNGVYVEHLIQPIFINCSLDFEIRLSGNLENAGEFQAGNDFAQTAAKMRILLNSDGDEGEIRIPESEVFESTGPSRPICNPKVMICMACFDDQDDIFNAEFQANIVKDVTHSSLEEKMMGLPNCQILANGTFQEWRNEANILSKVTKIPCPKHGQESCGLVAYVDFMDKCLDVNVSNNMQILPFKLNTSQCEMKETEECNVYPDLYSKGSTSGILAKNDHIRWLQNGMISKKKIPMEYKAKLEGMTTLADLYTNTQCQNKCEKMYNQLILPQETSNPERSLKSQVLELMQSFFQHLTSNDMSNQYRALGLFGKSVVECMKNRPTVCPYADEMIREWVQMVQSGKKRAENRRWFMNQWRKHHDYDGDYDHFGLDDYDYSGFGDYDHSGLGDYDHTDLNDYNHYDLYDHSGHGEYDHDEDYEDANGSGTIEEVECEVLDKGPEMLPHEDLCAVTSIVKAWKNGNPQVEAKRRSCQWSKDKVEKFNRAAWQLIKEERISCICHIRDPSDLLDEELCEVKEYIKKVETTEFARTELAEKCGLEEFEIVVYGSVFKNEMEKRRPRCQGDTNDKGSGSGKRGQDKESRPNWPKEQGNGKRGQGGSKKNYEYDEEEYDYQDSENKGRGSGSGKRGQDEESRPNWQKEQGGKRGQGGSKREKNYEYDEEYDRQDSKKKGGNQQSRPNRSKEQGNGNRGQGGSKRNYDYDEEEYDYQDKGRGSGKGQNKRPPRKTASASSFESIWQKFRRQKRSIMSHHAASIQPHYPPIMKLFRSSRLFEALLDCNQQSCKRNNAITECACYSIWAADEAKDVNSYCRNLNVDERNALKNVTIWTAKNQLKLMPDLYPWDWQYLASQLSENLTNTLASQTDGPTLKQIFLDFAQELNHLNNYTYMNNTTENEALVGNITLFLDSFEEYEQLADIMNQVNGFFALGKSCSLKGSEVGAIPTMKEYCTMEVGKAVLKNAMPCKIRSKNDEGDEAYEDYEKEPRGQKKDKKWNPKDDDFDVDIWEEETKAKKGQGKCMAQKYDNDWYWRKDGCLIQMGQFCELTGAYHWKNVASCQSCAACKSGGKRNKGEKGGKNQGGKGGKKNKGKKGGGKY